jgi:phytoene synthase
VPLEDLRSFGYAEADVADGIVDERFVELMKFEIERARGLYAVADEGIQYIPKGRRYPVVVARELYSAILGKIEEQDYDVYSKRADTTRKEKVVMAFRCAARDPGELVARTRGGKPEEIAIPS